MKRLPHAFLSTGLLALALNVSAVLTARIHASPPQYIVTDLGNYAGGSGINASGQVAGNASFGEYWLGVRWTGTSEGTLESLDGFPSGTAGYSINDSGQIAGFSAHGVLHAVRWTGTTPTDLGILDGTSSMGYGINASGQVAGEAGTASGAAHAVRWTGTTPIDLGIQPCIDSHGFTHTYDLSHGTGINDAGQVAGYAGPPSGPVHAVRWNGTTPELLDELAPGRSIAYGINASGQVVGFSARAGSEYRAVRWIGTTPTDLGTLGADFSIGYGINTSGDVVGMSDTEDGSRVAFLYTGGVMYNLQDLLVPGSGFTDLHVDQYGNSINDLGQIAASGIRNGVRSALRLTPAGTPLENWRTTYFGTPISNGDAADTADPDHDGIPNLVEFAFGLNPTLPDAAALPQAVAEGGYLTMTLTKHPGATYEVQSAATPAAADFSAATTTVLTDNATTLKVRDNVLIATSPARYLRVKVTAAP